jgi:hypothetical protein
MARAGGLEHAWPAHKSPRGTRALRTAPIGRHRRRSQRLFPMPADVPSLVRDRINSRSNSASRPIAAKSSEWEQRRAIMLPSSSVPWFLVEGNLSPIWSTTSDARMRILLRPHPEEARRAVSKDGAAPWPSWFETRLAALLTMRRETVSSRPEGRVKPSRPRRGCARCRCLRFRPRARRRASSTAAACDDGRRRRACRSRSRRPAPAE